MRPGWHGASRRVAPSVDVRTEEQRGELRHADGGVLLTCTPNYNGARQIGLLEAARSTVENVPCQKAGRSQLSVPETLYAPPP
jgi:hypothetical protein